MKIKSILAIIMAAIIVISVVLAINLGSSKSNVTEPSDESTTSTIYVTAKNSNTEETTQAQKNIDSYVDKIVKGYKSDWSSETPKEIGVSDILNNSSKNMGYVQTDLNSDGLNEYLIGKDDSKNGETVIYDIFTINKKGELIHLFSGDENNYCKITSKNTIEEVSSNSSEESITKQYNIKDGKLVETKTSKVSDYLEFELTYFSKLAKK